MSRKFVWVEAQEEYLIKRNIEKREVIEQMSDDELADLYFKIVEERGLEYDADEFTHKYCLENKYRLFHLNKMLRSHC